MNIGLLSILLTPRPMPRLAPATSYWNGLGAQPIDGLAPLTQTGGDPTELLEILAEHPDCYFQVFTNGQLITDAIAEKLARLAKINTYHVERLSGFLEKLRVHADGAEAAAMLLGSNGSACLRTP